MKVRNAEQEEVVHRMPVLNSRRKKEKPHASIQWLKHFQNLQTTFNSVSQRSKCQSRIRFEINQRTKGKENARLRGNRPTEVTPRVAQTVLLPGFYSSVITTLHEAHAPATHRDLDVPGREVTLMTGAKRKLWNLE